jgi:hypothetical protein
MEPFPKSPLEGEEEGYKLPGMPLLETGGGPRSLQVRAQQIQALCGGDLAPEAERHPDQAAH